MGLAYVRAHYLDVTGMRITAGRGFNREDCRDLAVVNEALATSCGVDL